MDFPERLDISFDLPDLRCRAWPGGVDGVDRELCS